MCVGRDWLQIEEQRAVLGMMTCILTTLIQLCFTLRVYRYEAEEVRTLG